MGDRPCIPFECIPLASTSSFCMVFPFLSCTGPCSTSPLYPLSPLELRHPPQGRWMTSLAATSASRAHCVMALCILVHARNLHAGSLHSDAQGRKCKGCYKQAVE